MSQDLPGSATATLADATDGSLVRRWRAGDESAAAELVRRYGQRLRALIASRCGRGLGPHVDADDIVQSVFRAAFQGVRNQGFDVPARQELWGLLLVLAMNRIRNQHRYDHSGKRDVQRLTGEAAEDLDRLASRDDAAPAFLRLVIDDELGNWPDPQRQMIRLRLEGHELAEIAARTRRSTRT